jgi:hypothetical protein
MHQQICDILMTELLNVVRTWTSSDLQERIHGNTISCALLLVAYECSIEFGHHKAQKNSCESCLYPFNFLLS